VEDQVAGDFVAEQFGGYVAGGGEDGRAALDVVGVGGNEVDGLVAVVMMAAFASGGSSRGISSSSEISGGDGAPSS
jgi:hypothetical protein